MDQIIPTKYYRLGSDYVGGFGGGAEPVAGAIEVPYAPKDAKAQWDGQAWVEPTKDEDEKIAEELLKQSISLEDRITALEKKVMENNSQEADAIQAIKEDVKS